MQHLPVTLPAMKERTLEGFGGRVGLSQRMVAYYEAQGGQPPGPILPELARALGVSSDELLGIEEIAE